MGGNIDTNEFSYQGIDDNSGVTIISGGYTSWDCVAAATYCINCDSGNNSTSCTSTTGQPFTGAFSNLMMEADIRWFWDDPTRHNYSWLDWTFSDTSAIGVRPLTIYPIPNYIDSVQGVIDYWQNWSNNNAMGLNFPAGISLEDFLLELYSTNLGNGAVPDGWANGLPVIRTAAFNAANAGAAGGRRFNTSFSWSECGNANKYL